LLVNSPFGESIGNILYFYDHLKQISGVQTIQTTSSGAFAAIRADGQVVTWGAYHGSDSSAVQDELRNVLQVQAADGAFAAIRGQGFKLVSNYLILQRWPVSGSQLKILKPRRWKCCDLGQCKRWRRQQRSPRSSSKCPAGAVD
jgi:hypothetical protein